MTRVSCQNVRTGPSSGVRVALDAYTFPVLLRVEYPRALSGSLSDLGATPTPELSFEGRKLRLEVFAVSNEPSGVSPHCLPITAAAAVAAET